MNEQRPLHRLFGLTWIDFFQGSDVEVQTELDLSLKQQFVDVVLIRRGPGPLPHPMPDGFEELAAHNLLTFKSHQEALDAWALWELVGHFVNYRKQSSPSLDELLPESDYRLFAVCARYPQGLSQRVPLTKLREGLYEVDGFGLSFRVIVLNQLPQHEENAMLHLFSSREELLSYGREHYRQHSGQTSTLLLQLIRVVREEPAMVDRRITDFIDEFVQKLSAEQRLKGLPLEERLKGLPVEERLRGLPVEERLKGLSVDDVLRALPPDMVEDLRRQLKTNGSTTQTP